MLLARLGEDDEREFGVRELGQLGGGIDPQLAILLQERAVCEVLPLSIIVDVEYVSGLEHDSPSGKRSSTSYHKAPPC